MIRSRALLLVDGSSDAPLGEHAAAIARRHGVLLDVVVPEFARMDRPPGHGVAARLQRMLAIDADFEALLVHRDSESRDPAERHREMAEAVASMGRSWPMARIVPVRMTEAWLLLDEGEIRRIAGRPSGTQDLELPPAERIESVPDPKSVLRTALKSASGLSGRRLRTFDRDFSFHRRQLLAGLDPNGPVRSLSAWQAMERELEALANTLREAIDEKVGTS